MKFDTDWIGVPNDDAPALSATVCRLTIGIGGKNACRLYDQAARSEQDHAVVPAYPLAEVLAMKWWWLMAGRSGELHFRRYREGFALPDIVVSVDGHGMFIEAKRYRYDNPPVVFLESATETESPEEFEKTAHEFITAVLERLHDQSLPDTLLAERWSDIARTRNDPEEMEFCEAAGAMGLDPYMCSEEDTRLILDAGKLFKKAQLSEVLASQDAGVVKCDLEWIAHQEQSRTPVTMRALASWGKDVRGAITSHTRCKPWELGYMAANETRNRLDVADDEPVPGLMALVKLCGGDRLPIGENHGRNIRAAVNVVGGEPAIVVGAFRDERAQAFALARAIGDYVVYGRSGRSPIMSTASYQQAVGRAFAAELLAPAKRVADYRAKGWEIEDIAGELNVSEKVVVHQTDNLARSLAT